ncbi:MAG: hypothetical protein IJS65_05260 [Clostridia bacterium]|nr:hypothetical protein [Clostridia bacterium]
MKSFFKSLKEPITSVEQANALSKQAKTYFIIALAAAIVLVVLGNVIKDANGIFTVVALIPGLFAILCFYVVYIAKRAKKRVQNLTCDKCGARLGDPAHTESEEASRRMVINHSDNESTGTVYVKVNFACKCPHCGTEKIFQEELRSGSIKVSDYSVNNDLVSVDDLVKGYLAGTNVRI